MYIERSPPIVDEAILLKDLKALLNVKEYQIDKEEFCHFMSSNPCPERYKNLFGDYLTEKLLEHYISLKLLNLQQDDVFIDIAADQSYFAEYVSKKYGIETYRQDIIYKKGISISQGCSIPLLGGDASFLPFIDNYISAMTLHCSLEHFEGDSDVHFIKEATRVLLPGGRICILPLYLGNQYYFITDPKLYDKSTPFDSDVYGLSGWNNRHGRIYSPKKFHERLAKEISGMNLTIYHISNLKDIDQKLHQDGLLYCSFAALYHRS
jgi:SAM-dependent methyltransferase